MCVEGGGGGGSFFILLTAKQIHFVIVCRCEFVYLQCSGQAYTKACGFQLASGFLMPKEGSVFELSLCINKNNS